MSALRFPSSTNEDAILVETRKPEKCTEAEVLLSRQSGKITRQSQTIKLQDKR